MWYFKKKDILERLGKDGKDVRYLERAIARWEVIEEWGRWCIVNEDEDGEVSHLRDRIRELEAEVKELKKSEWNHIEWALPWESDELSEAKIQWEYWEKKCRDYAQYCNDIVNVCYKVVKEKLWNKFQESEELFKEWIQNRVKLPED